MLWWNDLLEVNLNVLRPPFWKAIAGFCVPCACDFGIARHTASLCLNTHVQQSCGDALNAINGASRYRAHTTFVFILLHAWITGNILIASFIFIRTPARYDTHTNLLVILRCYVFSSLSVEIYCRILRILDTQRYPNPIHILCALFPPPRSLEILFSRCVIGPVPKFARIALAWSSGVMAPDSTAAANSSAGTNAVANGTFAKSFVDVNWNYVHSNIRYSERCRTRTSQQKQWVEKEISESRGRQKLQLETLQNSLKIMPVRLLLWRPLQF